MAERSGAVIQVFARAPQPGQAKTRLIPALGAEDAAFLHAGLLDRTLMMAIQTGAEVELWCTPDTAHPVFRYFEETRGVRLREQPEGDLGVRMASALQCGLASHQRAVLIGTDCPELSASILAEAQERLTGDDGWVIGPAEDGGYYLIGSSEACAGVFEGIAWGTERVYQQTIERFMALDLDWRDLVRLRDVDRPEDLLWFASHPSVIERGKDIVELAG